MRPSRPRRSNPQRWRTVSTLKAVTALFVLACASGQGGVGAASATDVASQCSGAAELRVVNRTNVLLELVEYDRTTNTTRVVSVVDPGVSHFPARGDVEVTYALRGLDATRKGWLTSDRVQEPSNRLYAVERRCR
jgi:hypothetical protein